MKRIVGGKIYDSETATLLADDRYWDGHNHERHGRNRYLYRTPRGRYFVVTATLWQGERDSLEPIGEDDAIALYGGPLTEHEVEYAAAFPNAPLEEA